MRFAWKATGVVDAEGHDTREVSFIVATEVESEQMARAKSMEGLLSYAEETNRLTLELTEILALGHIRG